MRAGLACVCVLLAGSHAWAFAQADAAMPNACPIAERPILLRIAEGVALEHARLVEGLKTELGADVTEHIDVSASCAPRGTLELSRFERGRYRVRYLPGTGEALEREISTADDDDAYAALTLLAGNLVRNEADSLLEGSPQTESETQTQAAAPSASRPAIAFDASQVPTAPAEPRELDLARNQSFRFALLAGATPRADGTRRAFVAPELSYRGASRLFAGESGVSFFEADDRDRGRDALHFRWDNVAELHVFLRRDLSFFTQLGLSTSFGGKPFLGYAARLSAGARYWPTPYVSVALETRVYGVLLGYWSAGGSSLPAGAFPWLGLLAVGLHFKDPL